ncbi:hypothetical protein KBB96_10320 [Luteolibacter ambystomatis]|uniref:Radical SAM protein n=1 Tax=Luteolibacter ambystomatis TaxID=2824561 RepID=A0A975G5P9_9BACT|nr:hypothetical protein [Luteolibacter ambystomatis]QUE49268.1 hypothetical protein KBB96_10320 [Luteolibacter ambystomatis]
MNRKPVLQLAAKTVLNVENLEFQEKLLCDGLVLNLGDACAYSCGYCYVCSVNRFRPPALIKEYNKENGTNLRFSDVVIRRKNAVELLRTQLLNKKGSPQYPDPTDRRVVYSSSLVDVAANMTLLEETAEACNLIFEHTSWQVRLLSKSNLLHKLIEKDLIHPRHHQRIIFGVSTGMLDDRIATAIEEGTPKVSKRLESLHWLQDHGLRTFGMICPSLPHEDYDQFSQKVCEAIQADRCEHVWAEVINFRGSSFEHSVGRLREHGLSAEADALLKISKPSSGALWEDYARKTFLAHTRNLDPKKLRFLQYVDEQSAGWWKKQRSKGAVLIGETAKKQGLVSKERSTPAVFVVTEIVPKQTEMGQEDIQFRVDREAIVTSAVRQTIVAAKALHEIHSYRAGILWNNEYPTFEAYCRAKWGYAKSQAYRLAACGDFLSLFESHSPNGEWMLTNESQIRSVLSLPRDQWVDCWKEIIAEGPPSRLSAREVETKTKQHRGDLQKSRDVVSKAAKHAPARKALDRLRTIISHHPKARHIGKLLDGIELLLNDEAG